MMQTEHGQNEEYVFNFQILLKDSADRDAIAAVLRERLASLDEVGELHVSTGATRAIDPVSIAAAVGVTILIVKQTTEAVEALTRLVKAVKKLVAEIEGVSETRLEVGDQVRRFEELGESDLEVAVRAALE